MATKNIDKIYSALYKICSKDTKLRPAITGVFHDLDNGRLVATDGHVLVAVKADYNPEHENKILGKDGEYIVQNYPKYKSIIPTKFSDNPLPTANDLFNAMKRLEKIKKISPEQFNISLNGFGFRTSFIKKAHRVFDLIKETPSVLLAAGSEHAMLFLQSENCVSIIMSNSIDKKKQYDWIYRYTMKEAMKCTMIETPDYIAIQEEKRNATSKKQTI